MFAAFADVVAIKARWSLSMDSAEYAKVKSLLSGQCAGLTVAPYSAPPA